MRHSNNTNYILTDGGLETTLVFHYNLELNHFAAFELLKTEAGKQALTNYYKPYLDIAHKYNTSFIIDTPTWRANQDWSDQLEISKDELKQLNIASVDFLRDLVKNHPIDEHRILYNGVVGPRGDGYTPDELMTPEQAKRYHLTQIKAFKTSGVDMITGVTINYLDEGLGIILAAKALEIPVAISFTVETDGRLPNGESLKECIEKIDHYTSFYASHYMINCAHPEHFLKVLKENGLWKNRIKGIRANASTMSHAELDACETLDAGDKHLLSHGYTELIQLLPNLKIIGGCCGTDHSHIEHIYSNLLN